MKIVMSKLPVTRNPKYSLSTVIYEEKSKKYVKKTITTQEAYNHLQSFPLKRKQLEENLLNNKIKINRIIDMGSDFLTFEFIDGVSYENLMYEALNNNDVDKFQNLTREYANLVRTSFKLYDLSEVPDNIPDELHDVYAKYSSAFLKQGVPFDITPSNIIIKNDGTYEIIDYEWNFSQPLPVEFVIFRGLYFSIIHFDSNALGHILHSKLLSSHMTLDDFQIIDNYLTRQIVPHMNNSLKNFCTKKEQIQRFAQLYFDYGNGFFEDNSEKHLIDMNKNNYDFSFSVNQGASLKNLRFDPLNTPCAIKLKSVTLFSGNKDIFKVEIFTTNGLPHENGKYYFNTDDPQVRFANIPVDILGKSDKIKITLEYLAYSENALDLYSQTARDLCDALYHKINSQEKHLVALQNKLNELNSHNTSLIAEKEEIEKKYSLEIKRRDETIAEKKRIIELKGKKTFRTIYKNHRSGFEA